VRVQDLATYMYDEHQHRCLTCMAVELPRDRMSPQHWSMRFVDRGQSNDHRATITINGEKDTRCLEALEGLPGWVIRERDPWHRCDCGADNECVEWEIADVVVTPPVPRLMDGQLVNV